MNLENFRYFFKRFETAITVVSTKYSKFIEEAQLVDSIGSLQIFQGQFQGMWKIIKEPFNRFSWICHRLHDI